MNHIPRQNRAPALCKTDRKQYEEKYIFHTYFHNKHNTDRYVKQFRESPTHPQADGASEIKQEKAFADLPCPCLKIPASCWIRQVADLQGFRRYRLKSVNNVKI
jgi:hypothetical protein